jgi:predicted permease
MPLLSRLLSLWRNLFHKTRAEQQLREEVDTYLEMLIGMKIEQGIDPEEARRQALIEMGGVEQVKERVRETRMGHHLEALWKDMSYAVRSLRKHALLSIVVIATLTLGMGISTGIFMLINAGLLRPKVDHDPDSYVEVFSSYSSDPLQVSYPGQTTVEDYLAFRDRARSMRDVAGWMFNEGGLGDDDDAPNVRALFVTCNFFSLHNPGQPILGRLLQPADCAEDNPVIVVSERLWRHRFGADPEIVGKLTHFNGKPLTVVGVAPTSSGEINGTNIWMPYTPRPATVQEWLNVGGRLQPGFSRREVAVELALLAIQQDRLYPGRKTTHLVTDGSNLQHPNFSSRRWWGLFLTLGIIICIVLITCANVAALLLSRAAARQHEIAVRLTLGAGRIRLLRMLLVETLILATVAGVASLYAARLPILLFWLGNSPLKQPPGQWFLPDWRVFTYLTAITLLAGILAGLAPALQSLKVNLVESLKGRQPLSGGARGGVRLGSLLVGTQVALSLVLLVGAVLFERAYRKISTVDPGYETRQVLSMVLEPKDARSWRRAAPVFYQTLAQSLEALPGVHSVAFTNLHPQNRYIMTLDIEVPGQPARQVRYSKISPAFFSTLGIPLMTGRALQESDQAFWADRRGESCPVVVSAELARQFWPKANPLGRMLRQTDSPPGKSYEVVGVARDISTQQLGRPDPPMLYLPWITQDNSLSHSALLRFSGDGAALARAAKGVTRKLAPEFRVEARTIQSYIEEKLHDLRRAEMLIVILGAIPVGLAVLGIYGVVSFDVSRRTKEIGIRLALGARKRDIYGAVLAASGRPVAFGLLVGLVLALAGATVLAKTAVADQINTHDPLAFIAAALLLAAVALGALLWPARRATRVDPLTALRDE